MKNLDGFAVKQEGSKTIIELDSTLKANIWQLVMDWPEIISNEENMRLL